MYEDFTFSTSAFLTGLKKPEREAYSLPQLSAVRTASLHGASMHLQSSLSPCVHVKHGAGCGA